MKKQQQKQKRNKRSRKIFSKMPVGGINTNTPFAKEYNAVMHYVTPITLSGSTI